MSKVDFESQRSFEGFGVRLALQKRWKADFNNDDPAIREIYSHEMKGCCSIDVAVIDNRTASTSISTCQHDVTTNYFSKRNFSATTKSIQTRECVVRLYLL